MRFFRRSSYTESIFETEYTAPEHAASATALGDRIEVWGPLSPGSIADDEAFLAQDPMHGEMGGEALMGICADGELDGRDEEVGLEGLEIGDVVVDEEGGVEWVVRRCFCESGECCGKTFKRRHGKEELDVWDRGRPAACG